MKSTFVLQRTIQQCSRAILMFEQLCSTLDPSYAYTAYSYGYRKSKFPESTGKKCVALVLAVLWVWKRVESTSTSNRKSNREGCWSGSSSAWHDFIMVSNFNVTAKQNVFARIVRKEEPAVIVYEDDIVLAFKDANPAAPCHLLIVPKVGAVRNSNYLGVQHVDLLEHMWASHDRLGRSILQYSDSIWIFAHCSMKLKVYRKMRKTAARLFYCTRRHDQNL